MKKIFLLLSLVTSCALLSANDRVELPYYESFLGDIGNFTINDVNLGSLTKVWTPTEAYGMKATGYYSGNHAAESWLVSPLIALPNAQNICLSFYQVLNYLSDESLSHAQVKISMDNGNSWTNLTFLNNPTGHNWTFYHSCVLLDQYAGQDVRIAFVYSSTDAVAPTWEIKEFSVKIAPTSGQCGESLNWNLDTNSGLLTVTGSGDMWDSIPNLKWHTYASLIEKVNLPNGLTSIGIDAFANCQRLQSVIIPEGVTSIAPGAFSYCFNLASVNLPNSVTRLGQGAFWECNSLTNPIYNSRIFAFMPRTFEGSYVIPDGIVSVASFSFHNCSKLQKIILPESTERIGQHAFAYCDSLQTVVCKATVPPTCAHSVFVVTDFDSSYPKMTSSALYVPATSLEDYKTADTWKDFNPILPIQNSEAIESVSAIYDESTKILRNGNVYILYDNKLYTTTGQEVK